MLMTYIYLSRRLCTSQTTFKQATKNLHQILCLSEITLLLGLGLSPPCEKHVRTASLDKNVEMTSLTKYNPHSSSVPTPNTLRCLPRNYGYVIRREATSRKDLLALLSILTEYPVLMARKIPKKLKNFLIFHRNTEIYHRNCIFSAPTI